MHLALQTIETIVEEILVGTHEVTFPTVIMTTNLQVASFNGLQLKIRYMVITTVQNVDPLQQQLGVPTLAPIIMLLLTYQILTTPVHIMVMTHFMLVMVILFLFSILVHQKYSHPPQPLILRIFFMDLKFKRIFYLLNNFVTITM